eukprot:5424318-Alexandrium_andersonii.AAC.1
MQFWPQQTRQALRLVQDMPCSIGLVEKGHAAGAFVRRYHATLGQDQLEARAFVNEARALFRPSRHEQDATALQRQFAALLAAAGKVRFTAANLFCAKAIAEAKHAASQQGAL